MFSDLWTDSWNQEQWHLLVERKSNEGDTWERHFDW